VSLRRVTDLDALAWNDGLVPVVVQEIATGAVLMLAWADREAVRRTLGTGEGWFWSRSRRELWRKGATSGNVLTVAEVAVDCDGDTLLYRVDAAGPACHTGARSCFEAVGHELGGDDATSDADALLEGRDEGDRGGRGGGGEDAAGPRLELGWLWDVLVERAGADPADSYTARLLAAGVDRIARKVGEEATEVVIAALRSAPASPRQTAAHVPPPAGSVSGSLASVATPPLAPEAADLLYHLLVLLLAAGVPPDEVAAELRRRHARPSTPASAKPEDGAAPPAGAAPTAKAPASPSPKPEDRA
jgi:phosphoribosyl-AMP cyclohydrolase / phosphoribosyl-ATP pyrophosphohydrolase